MVILKQIGGAPVIQIQMEATEAEYVEQLKGLAQALSLPQINAETRRVIGGLLIEMLPQENQVNLKR
jgi:hypothetical protein